MKWKLWPTAKRLGGKRCGIACGLKYFEEHVLSGDTVPHQCFPERTFMASGCQMDNNVSFKKQLMPHNTIEFKMT